MTLIGLIVAIAVAAILLWGLTQLPLDPTLAKIIRVLVIVVVAIVCVMFLAQLFGYSGGPNLRLR